MTTWGRGDYPSMAATLVDVSRSAVRWAEVRPGEHVLDLATGTGNAALLAAADGGTVVGVDAEPILLAEAARRAARSGLAVEWRTCDLASTDVLDGWADIVLSVFGVMCGGDAAAAMTEVRRCLGRPGRAIFAAWQPESLLPAFGATVAPFLPPAPVGVTPPSHWGDPTWLDDLASRFALHVEEHRFDRVTWSFRDADAAVDFFVACAGHVVSIRPELEADGRWKVLRDSLRELFLARGIEVDGALELEGAYLLTRLVAA